MAQCPSESRADKIVLLEAPSRLILKTSMDEDPPGNLFQCFIHYLQSEEKYQLMGKTPKLSSQSLCYWTTGTCIRPTENLSMKKTLLLIQRFSGISGLCTIGTGKSRFKPKNLKDDLLITAFYWHLAGV